MNVITAEFNDNASVNINIIDVNTNELDLTNHKVTLLFVYKNSK